MELHARDKEQIAKQHTAHMISLIQKHPDIIRSTDKTIPPSVEEILCEQNEARVSKYRKWIINQALVSFVTFFDAFLEDLVDMILAHNPKLLYEAKAAKDITLKRIHENGVDSFIEEVRKKEVGHFAYLTGIGSRIGYLESKLELGASDIFDMSNFTDGSQFSHWNVDHLSILYDKRHSIVHHDKYPIKTIDELKEISAGLTKVIMNVSMLASDKYNIMLDVNRTILQQELYDKYSKNEEIGKAT